MFLDTGIFLGYLYHVASTLPDVGRGYMQLKAVGWPTDTVSCILTSSQASRERKEKNNHNRERSCRLLLVSTNTSIFLLIWNCMWEFSQYGSFLKTVCWCESITRSPSHLSIRVNVLSPPPQQVISPFGTIPLFSFYSKTLNSFIFLLQSKRSYSEPHLTCFPSALLPG